VDNIERLYASKTSSDGSGRVGGHVTIYANVLSGTTPGETWSTTLHTSHTGGTTADANTAFATAVAVLWNDGGGAGHGIVEAIPTTVTATLARTAQLDPLTGKQVDAAESSLALAGSAVAGLLPYQDTIVASLFTDTATRAGRGRMYLPVFATSAVNAGRLTAAFRAQVATAVQHFVQNLNTAGYQVVIYHRTPKTFTPVTKGYVGDVFDTQRRRRDKLVEVRSTFAV
jgi:hypothetical protein